MVSPMKRRSNFRASLISGLMPCLVLVSALGLTGLAWDHEERVTQARMRTQFDFALREISSRIEQHIAAYELTLRSVASHIASRHTHNKAITTSDLAHFVDSLKLDANYSGIESIDFSPRKTADLPPAMARARDSGQAAISTKSPPEMGQATSPSATVQMYFPVYAHAMGQESVSSRRDSISGWVRAEINLDSLMASLYGERPAGISYAVYDGVEMNAGQRLYQSSPSLQGAGRLSTQEYLVVGGQTWTVSLTSQPSFETLHGQNGAWKIAGAGACMSLLLAFLTWQLSTSRDRALQIARAMTRELRESEQRWAFALEGTGDGVWDWDLRTRVAINSPRWHEIVACPNFGRENSMDGWQDRIHPDDLALFLESRNRWLENPELNQASWVIEHRICCPKTADKWILLRGMVAERDEQGQPLRVIGTITDITERHAADASIRHQAQHDNLTGLPNRALFHDRLQQALANAQRNKACLGLVFLDLDNFKPINDQHGHAAGDMLLQTVAQRLRQTIRAVDTVARIGGDEFVLLLTELDQPDSAIRLAEKIRQSVLPPTPFGEHRLEISCSMGVADYPGDGLDAQTLIRHADMAMYRAKQSGRNQIHRTY